MGAWGVKPWDNDEAADWFSDAFEGADLDAKVSSALAHDYDNYDEVRAAAYLLSVIGRTYVWPGDLDKLDGHINRAIDLLTRMIDENSTDEDMDFLELWDNDPEVVTSVKEQIDSLKALV